MTGSVALIAFHAMLATSSDWAVMSEAGGCGASAQYAGVPRRSVSLIVSDKGPDLLAVTLSADGWSIIEGGQYPVTIGLDAGTINSTGIGSKYADGKGHLMMLIDLDALDAIARSRAMTIMVRDKVVSVLSLEGSAKAVSAMRTCIARLPAVVEARRVAEDERRREAADPFATIVPTQPLNQSGPADWVTADDYPPSALNLRQSGTTAYRFDVNGFGRISNCVVTSSSGSAALDRATCSALVRRGRYDPSFGGRTIAGKMTWTLPAQ